LKIAVPGDVTPVTLEVTFSDCTHSSVVAKVATDCRAGPIDLFAAKRVAWRSADARICR
jgi:hypothetical protein